MQASLVSRKEVGESDYCSPIIWTIDMSEICLASACCNPKKSTREGFPLYKTAEYLQLGAVHILRGRGGLPDLLQYYMALLLALDSVKFECTLKMTERPNICYIFEKLSVQGCQI